MNQRFEGLDEAVKTALEATLEPLKRYNLMPLTTLFLLMAVTFVFLGSLVQGWNFNYGILITEFGMLVIPATLYMVLRRQPLRAQFRFKTLPLKSALLIGLAGLCFVPVVGLSNAIVNLWLFYGLGMTPPEVPTQSGALGPIISFAIVALTPGFCEEFFFRGMVMTELEKRMSQFGAAVVTAVLFGLFHFNFMNCFGPMILGLIFAYTVQVTDSIWAGMLGHAVNNSTAVVLLYVSAGAGKQDVSAELAKVGQFWPFMVLLSLLMLAAIALPLAYLGTRLLKKMRLNHLKAGDQLVIAHRQFLVLEADRSSVHLEETTADGECQVIQTSYERLRLNKRMSLSNPHWQRTMGGFEFKWSEWWPMILFGIMYVVVAFMTFNQLLAVTAAQ